MHPTNEFLQANATVIEEEGWPDPAGKKASGQAVVDVWVALPEERHRDAAEWETTIRGLLGSVPAPPRARQAVSRRTARGGEPSPRRLTLAQTPNGGACLPPRPVRFSIMRCNLWRTGTARLLSGSTRAAQAQRGQEVGRR